MKPASARLLTAVAALGVTLAGAAASAQSAAPATLGDALAGGAVETKLRAYFMNRTFVNIAPDVAAEPDLVQKATAAGAWVTYRSQPWHGLSLGLGGSGSLRLGGDRQEDGTRLLAPGQRGYSVPHLAYLEVASGPFTVVAGRQKLATPLLASLDNRITPITFEALAASARLGRGFGLQVVHVTGVKVQNATSFAQPSRAAGLPGPGDPATLAGLTWQPRGSVSLQLWETWLHEVMSSTYLQGDVSAALQHDWKLTWSLQAHLQRDVGRALAGRISTGLLGTQVAVERGGLRLALAFSGVRDGSDMLYPLSANPTFTSLVEEDLDLAGERAVGFSLAIDFTEMGVPGVRLELDRTRAYAPPGELRSSRKDQFEDQAILDVAFRGPLSGLALHLMAARVDSGLETGVPATQDINDRRIVLSYSLSTTPCSLARH